MPELIARSSRRSQNHKWDNIIAKEGDDTTVTLNAKERALVFSMLSFASTFPNFMIEFDEETQRDDVDAFLSAIVSKLA